MGYMHIDNLYKNQDILEFKECYAMEKIHGTSAHISYENGNLSFFSGGEKHENFIKLFDKDELLKRMMDMDIDKRSLHVYGEAYGGKCQGMKDTYGPHLRFIAFEVKIGEHWLPVPKAEKLCLELGLEFVHYVKIPTTLEAIDEQRDTRSIQAIRNGIVEERLREGIVLRPLVEVIKNDGTRVIAKHKRDEFRETTTPRNIRDKLEKRTAAKAIIAEWLTEERLNHILTSGKVDLRMEDIGKVITLMVEDITREGAGEIEMSSEVTKAIGRETALMMKRKIKESLYASKEEKNI